MMRTGRLVVGLVGLAVFFLLLYMLRSVLLPFVGGMAVAYFLDPVADRLQRLGCSRTVAVALITAAFFLAIILVLSLLIPVLQVQILGFIGHIPAYVESLRSQLGPLLNKLAAVLPAHELAHLRAAAGSYLGTAVQWLAGLIQGVFQSGIALINLAALLVVTPLVAFYLLRDWDRVVAEVDSLLPRSVAPTVRDLAKEVDRMLAGFVRGQATVCLLLAAYYATGLSVVGLDFGLLVGMGTGFLSFIPIFGMSLGLLTGTAIAIAQFGSWGHVLLVVAVFAIGQTMEANVLTPWLVGGRVRLHPVWVIFAVLAGGVLIGFTGVMLSIPIAATIGVVVRFAVDRYRHSRLYGPDKDAGT